MEPHNFVKIIVTIEICVDYSNLRFACTVLAIVSHLHFVLASCRLRNTVLHLEKKIASHNFFRRAGEGEGD